MKCCLKKDVRYDEILNSFDVMVSDYSSIVYDYLLLNRPVVYLLPDFEEYKMQKDLYFITYLFICRVRRYMILKIF